MTEYQQSLNLVLSRYRLDDKNKRKDGSVLVRQSRTDGEGNGEFVMYAHFYWSNYKTTVIIKPECAVKMSGNRKQRCVTNKFRNANIYDNGYGHVALGSPLIDIIEVSILGAHV